MNQKTARAKTSSRTKKRKSCPHCSGGPETYEFLRMYEFDVDSARRLVLDGRTATELETDDVRYSVDLSRIYDQHLKHVNIKYPGIVAHYWYPEPDGTILHGHVLIDGHHRAARCLEIGAPFFVHLLTEAESRQIVLKAPDVQAILANH